ncbi:MAG TPA: phosphotransferase [Myxococcota bacterium]|nr:phosphotransferase [Myxococcota bacterium]
MASAPDHAELTPVREAHRFDEAALATYLRGRLPGCNGALRVQQFEGGQSNPTYRIEAGGHAYVLRKKPPGKLLPSAHQVEREYRVISALQGSDVPVPRTRLLCEDPDVIGTPFYLMDCVEGRLLTDARMPRLTRDERIALYADFVRVLAALHSLDPAAIGLADFGRPGNYYVRQIARWSQQYTASQTEDIPAMKALMDWLPAHVPESDETRVVHGDYRVGNCIVHPSEPRVIAVLDWELSTLGHPLGDLAYFCQGYHGEAVPGETLVGVDFAATGIPDEAAVLARYCRLTGRERIDDWSFYLVFVMFRSAAIVQGVYKRGLDGNAASQRAQEYGALVRRRADQALELVQR